MKIKVIKNKNVKNIKKILAATESDLRQKSEKEMISTVSFWVREFQQRRREERVISERFFKVA